MYGKQKKTNLKRKKEVGLVFVMSCCHKHDMCAYKKIYVKTRIQKRRKKYAENKSNTTHLSE